MFKKLLAVALAVLATLMIIGCQQPNNVPEEKVDPNMPELIYENPDMYNTIHLIMNTRIGDIDFYFVSKILDDGVYLLGFTHTDDKTVEQVPIIAERICYTSSITGVKGFVTKENVYQYITKTGTIFVPAMFEITGTVNLLEPDKEKANTENYAGWAAIVPSDPKAGNPEKAKFSDSIYIMEYEASGIPSGEKDNISALAGYGTWNAKFDFMNVSDELPKMSDETQEMLFGEVLWI